MKRGMNRREILAGGLVAGVSLALPLRASADALTQSFDTTFAKPRDTTGYQQRVLQVAKREVERAGSQVWRRDIAGIADFAQPSAQPRFHFANLENGTVRSFYVAHGRGSDPDHCGYLRSFSNEPGSFATSRGAYLTCEWYNG
jgi:hypothetical protein